MTKDEFRQFNQLHKLPRFELGRGFGYKANGDWSEFTDDEIIYIPERAYHINQEWGLPCLYIDDEQNAFTKSSLLKICGNDEEKAKRIFIEADWQFPQEVLDEIVVDDEETIVIDAQLYIKKDVLIGIDYILNDKFHTEKCFVYHLIDTIHNIESKGGIIKRTKYVDYCGKEL